MEARASSTASRNDCSGIFEQAHDARGDVENSRVGRLQSASASARSQAIKFDRHRLSPVWRMESWPVYV